MSFDGTQPTPRGISTVAIPGVHYPSMTDMLLLGDTCDGEGIDPLELRRDPLRKHVDPNDTFDESQPTSDDEVDLDVDWHSLSPAAIEKTVYVIKMALCKQLRVCITDYEPSDEIVCDAIEDGMSFSDLLDMAHDEYELRNRHPEVLAVESNDEAKYVCSAQRVNSLKKPRRNAGLSGSTFDPVKGVGYDSHGRLPMLSCPIMRAEKKGRKTDPFARPKAKPLCDRRETIRKSVTLA